MTLTQGSIIRFLLKAFPAALMFAPILSFGQSYTIDAVSREVSLFNDGPPSHQFEAISREVSVFDAGVYSIDAVSREVSLFNFGLNNVTISIGSAVVPVGITGAVPVTFSTLVPLTNVLVAVGFPANSLTNWSVSPQPPLIGSTVVSNNSELYASFSSPTGQTITTNLQPLGQLVFTPGSNQPSAFLPLLVDGVASSIPSGPVATQTASVQDGEVVVLNTNSLLRWMQDTNGLGFIDLYGYFGTNYTIEATTNLRPSAIWIPIYSSLTPSSNYIAVTPDVIMTNRMMFFRAKQ